MKIPHLKLDVTPRVADQVRRVKIQLAFLATHGPFGEDGTLQGLLDMMRIPYTGSGVLASAVAMHKPSSKRLFESAGLPTPPWFTIRVNDPKWLIEPREARKWLEGASPKTTWVLKPASQGSAIGITVVRNQREWKSAIRRAAALDREILVEKFVPGVEVTAAVLGERCLPLIEIVPKHGFYDFYSKYTPGGSQHLIPARLTPSVQKKAADLSLKAFRLLGCRHLARVDLIVSRRGVPTLLEVNTLPGFTNTSLFSDAAKAAGLSFDDLILEILFVALIDARVKKN